MFLKLVNVCLIFESKKTRMTSFQTFIEHQL